MVLFWYLGGLHISFLPARQGTVSSLMPVLKLPILFVSGGMDHRTFWHIMVYNYYNYSIVKIMAYNYIIVPLYTAIPLLGRNIMDHSILWRMI